MTAEDIEDLMSRPAEGIDTLMAQILAQIRDSLTAINRKQDHISAKVDDSATRIVRLEERNERLSRVEGLAEKNAERINALMKDKDRRDGAVNFVGKIPNWLSFLVALASVFSALWLFGRSVGVVPAPPIPPAKVEAVIHPDQRRIEGTVGGTR